MAEGQDQEDKTEDASERRIEQALEKGDVPRSQELTGFFTLLSGMAATGMMLTTTGPSLAAQFAGWLGGVHDGIEGRVWTVSSHVGLALAEALVWPFLAVIVAGIGANAIMHAPRIILDPLLPKFNRISPMSGAKRIFGVENLVQFGKTLAKLALVVAVLWALVTPGKTLFYVLGSHADVRSISGPVLALSVRLIAGVLALYATIAVLDAVWQRFSWKKKLRMSLHEVKEEHKESEGNPEIKAKIKQIRNAKARQRMMQAVPKATVIIANPTHYAVALRFEVGMTAPVCLAKGVDEVALKIREVGEAHAVPVVENVPLARALYASAEIDREIPVEHYKAVAEVIGFVMRLARRGR